MESLTKLLGLIEVDTVYLKDPSCDTDEYFYISLTEKLSSARTSIALWGKALYIGDLSVSSLYNYDIEKEEARIALSLRCEEYDLVYLSSGMLEIDTINEATEYTSGADALILGRFGAAYSSICYYGSKYATQDNVYIEGALVALSQKAYERYIAKNKGVHAHEGGYVLYVK